MKLFTRIFQMKSKQKNEEEMLRDFKRRIPFWGYRPVRYSIMEDFKDYKTDIDDYLERIFSGEVDDGNANILDDLILDMARQAERNLSQQRTDHEDSIKSIDIRAKSDKRAFELELERIKKSLEDNKINQLKYVQLLENDEFFKGGRKHENEEQRTVLPG